MRSTHSTALSFSARMRRTFDSLSSIALRFDGSQSCRLFFSSASHHAWSPLVGKVDESEKTQPLQNSASRTAFQESPNMVSVHATHSSISADEALASSFPSSV